MTRTVHMLWLASLAGCASSGPQNASKGIAAPEGTDIIGILITPSEVIVPSGGTLQLEAMGLNAAREAVNLTDAVDWGVENAAVLDVSNDFEQEGMLRGLTSGATIVTADLDGLQSAPARVVVTEADLERLSVAPGELTIVQGDSVQLAAEAGFSDGSASTVNGQVRWITADGTTATVSGDGMVTAERVGSTEVWVEWKGVESEPISIDVVEIQPSEASDLLIDAAAGSMADGTLTVAVEVRNNGIVPAAGFWVDLFLDPDDEPAMGDVPDAYRMVDYVGANSQTTIVFELNSAESDHEFAVVADALDAVAESDESNNWKWGSASDDGHSVGSETGMPNISIVYAGGFSTDAGTEFWIDAVNTGSAPADGFYIDVFVDRSSDEEPSLFDDGDQWVLVSGLGAGETAYETLLVDADCDACGSWAMVDGYNFVAESDETDNTLYFLTVSR